MIKKPVNSKQKGKRAELQACAYLKKLGITAARSVQYSGMTPAVQRRKTAEAPQADLVLDGQYSTIHVEVKMDGGIGLGTKKLRDAMDQSIRDAGKKKEPCVLWRVSRGKWCLSWATFTRAEGGFCICTVCGDEDVKENMKMLSIGW